MEGDAAGRRSLLRVLAAGSSVGATAAIARRSIRALRASDSNRPASGRSTDLDRDRMGGRHNGRDLLPRGPYGEHRLRLAVASVKASTDRGGKDSAAVTQSSGLSRDPRSGQDDRRSGRRSDRSRQCPGCRDRRGCAGRQSNKATSSAAKPRALMVAFASPAALPFSACSASAARPSSASHQPSRSNRRIRSRRPGGEGRVRRSAARRHRDARQGRARLAPSRGTYGGPPRRVSHADPSPPRGGQRGREVAGRRRRLRANEMEKPCRGSERFVG